MSSGELTDDGLAGLLARLVAVQVELFDAADARVREATGAPLIALLPLRVIAARPGCRIQELAEGLAISVGGASKSADRLERNGWAHRVAHPSDRRSSVLELTASGQQLVEKGNAALAEVVRERVESILGAAGTARLGADLERLWDGAHEAPPLRAG